MTKKISNRKENRPYTFEKITSNLDIDQEQIPKTFASRNLQATYKRHITFLKTLKKKYWKPIISKARTFAFSKYNYIFQAKLFYESENFPSVSHH